MSRIIDAAGNLIDFQRVQGDPKTPQSGPSSNRQRWGATRFLNKLAPNNRAIVVATGDLGKAYPINVQLRFASADAQGNVVLPWTNVFQDPTGLVLVTVKRGLDPDAATTQETLTIDGSLAHPPSTGGVMPFDTMTARSMEITVELFNALLVGQTGLWVECIAAPVEDIATRNKIVGWPVQKNKFFAAGAALQQFLIARPDRVQFMVCNTSTNANLMIGYDATASWVGPKGSIVLPQNIFAQYESPVGGWRGDVFGIWSGAGDGGALVTEGTMF